MKLPCDSLGNDSRCVWKLQGDITRSPHEHRLSYLCKISITQASKGLPTATAQHQDPSRSPLMNTASQLFKRATFPLGGNNVFVQNLLRRLSTCCFFRMSLCLQPIERPMFTMEPAGISSGAASSAGTTSPTFLGGQAMSSCQSPTRHAHVGQMLFHEKQARAQLL